MSQPHKILVVDDDANVRQLLATRLHPPEFEVHAFADARRAITSLDKISPDLIICDVLMPHVDGREFLRAVRNLTRFQTVPFVFLSGVRSPDEIQSALEAGAADYLKKPFPFAELLARVRRLLEAQSLRGATGVAVASADSEAPAIARQAVDAAPPASLSAAPARLQQPRLEGGWGERRSPIRGAQAAWRSSNGALTTLEVDGERVQVLTEPENSPNFTLTTVISVHGLGRRQIQSRWQHPLRRIEDAERIAIEIQVQHSSVIARVRDVTLETPRRSVLWGRPGRSDDGRLLARALNAVLRSTLSHVNPDTARQALSRVQRRLIEHRPILDCYIIRDDDVAYLAGRTDSPMAEHVAAWLLAFLTEVRALDPMGARREIERGTRLMREELRDIGFYDAIAALVPGGQPRDPNIQPQNSH